ncbi:MULTISPECIES: SRPBCC family protein [Dyella]|uniref:SRPBCC family protein n=2 Tax=Dyella TaxID=231454 RepID=A0A4R0YKV7_9GAMM|nr:MULTISPECIES: SRPBCC family protein [Dyella]TBR36283.1 SRPBCC family protein [Dyella terrae]TCI05939.1 SRPBCC family protein [Dyella soli]
MATIIWEQSVAVPASTAWALLRQFDKAHELFHPVLIAGRMEADIRVLTFANGLQVRERKVAVNEAHQRVAYTVLGDMFEHHAASMQIVGIDANHCCFLWISDFLPDALASTVLPLVKQGATAFAATLETNQKKCPE